MKSDVIRDLFISFFEKNNHLRIVGSSLIPSDPTLLFTIAGMVPLKPYFTGVSKPPSDRVVTVQPCVRVNDIEQIGVSSRHLSFLEMLGNFSFGDYFKEKSISFAWDLVTNGFKVSEEKLLVTIYRDDEESFTIWNKIIGLPENRIIPMGESDNFWRMGEVGPCGPCSEIYFDRGSGSFDIKEFPGERFLEFWNLVFMQYYCENSKLEALPKKNIDTGLGLERFACILQNKPTIFETDLFQPLISKAEEVLEVNYKDSVNIVPLRIISDHIRTITFLFSEGLTPSNEWRGYVLRRLIRRAFLKGYRLGIKKAFLYKLTDVVVNTLGDFYPILKENSKWVQDGIKLEENKFLNTIGKGLDYFNEHLKNLKEKNISVFSGKDAFFLYDTFGFPLELQKELLEEEGLVLDESSFKIEMEKQKQLSRKSGIFGQTEKVFTEKNDEFMENIPQTIFVGYDSLVTKSKVLRKEMRSDGVCEFILDTSPIYSYGGGELSDHGYIESDNGNGFIFDSVFTTNGRIIHLVKMLQGNIEENEEVVVSVDSARRKSMEIHHTLTHLLQSSLRKVLGDQIKQAGSLVSPDYLRFDFTFNRALTENEVMEVEKLVNHHIMMDYKVSSFIRPYKEALELGATAIFSEKYGDYVRVIKIDDISIELCSGTHLKQTGEAGFFCILKEEGIGTGLRRIEAVGGIKAYEHINSVRNEVRTVKQLINHSGDLVTGVSKLLDSLKEIQNDKDKLISYILDLYTNNIIESLAVISGDINLIVNQIDILDAKSIRKLADIISEKFKEYVIVFIGSDAGYIFTKSSPKAIKIGFHSGNIANKIALLLGGKGGGNLEVGQGGFNQKDRVPKLMPQIIDEICKIKEKIE